MDDERLAVDEPAAPAGALDERALVLGEHLAGAEADRAQALDHRDEAVVAQRSSSRTDVPRPAASDCSTSRSSNSSVSSGTSVSLRPRPGQRRAELRHEVPHARLAAGDPVGEERAHAAPAQPGAEADGVVDLLDRGDVVVDEPQRLAPQRLEQPVGDEPVDLRRSRSGRMPTAR